MTGKEWVAQDEAATEAWYRQNARARGSEVDDDAVVSLGDDPGAYVQTWTWIEAPVCDMCGESVTECQGECEDDGARTDPGGAGPAACPAGGA